MKRRIFAALLAGAMILSLAACGGGNGGGSSSASGSGSTGGASSSQDGSASSDPSAPDGSLPGGSSSSGSSSSSADASSPSGSSSSSGSGSSSGAGDSSKPSGQVTLKLNKTKIALNKAGATFKLRCTTDPEIDADPTYTSSDEKVATVDKKGTVTAVAPGKATITVECGGASATAAVTCDWKEETQPAPDTPTPPDASAPVVTPPVSTVPVPPSGPVTITPTPPASSGGSTTPSVPEPAKVDLSSFYSATTGKYEFGSLEKADSAVLDQIYSGLTGVGTEQSMVYVTMMSMNNGEFGLVQVKDSKDVDTVKKIFQDRIAYMVGDGNGPGGAYYPSAMDQWENNSRVVSNGNYVMLVVHENCDDIVGEFNALFK